VKDVLGNIRAQTWQNDWNAVDDWKFALAVWVGALQHALHNLICRLMRNRSDLQWELALLVSIPTDGTDGAQRFEVF